MTLKELLKDAKFPVKVRHENWAEDEWVELLAPARRACIPGFWKSGLAAVFSIHADDGWCFYIEPKPKKKMYGFIEKDIQKIGPWNVVLHIEDNDDMLRGRNLLYIRAPHFDCEVDQ